MIKDQGNSGTMVAHKDTGMFKIPCDTFLGKYNLCYSLFYLKLVFTDTMVRSESGTVVVNSEVNTLVDSELGTMVINDTDDEESTMKRKCHQNTAFSAIFPAS